MADLNAIKEQLDGLTLLEASQLVSMLEEAWGVSAAAPVAMAAMAGPAAAVEEVEEQTEFDVVLTDVGAKKINVIKAVRSVTTLGLKEAKELVESTPATVVTGVNKETAQDVKQKLEAEGAVVQMK